MKTTDRLRRAGPATGMAAVLPSVLAAASPQGGGQTQTVPVTLGTLSAG